MQQCGLASVEGSQFSFLAASPQYFNCFYITSCIIANFYLVCNIIVNHFYVFYI